MIFNCFSILGSLKTKSLREKILTATKGLLTNVGLLMTLGCLGVSEDSGDSKLSLLYTSVVLASSIDR